MEGDESYTTTSCQQRYNKSLVARGGKPLTKWQWYEFVCGEKGTLWKVMENVGKTSVHTRDVRILLPRKINSEEASRGCRERTGNQGHKARKSFSELK